MTALAPFEAATNLWDQLRLIDNSVLPFFTVEEIEAFADYCMGALQHAPEVVRNRVTADFTRAKKMRHGWDHQRVFLEEEKLNVEMYNDDAAAAREVESAAVDLQAMLDGQDSHARRAFLMTLSDAAAACEHVSIYPDSFFSDTGYQLAAQRWTTEEDLVAFCKEIHTAMSRTYPVQRAGQWLKVTKTSDHGKALGHVTHIQLSNGAVVQASHIVEYAQLVSLFLSYADELESAGWQKEYLSHRSYGRLCTWFWPRDEAPVYTPQPKAWRGTLPRR